VILLSHLGLPDDQAVAQAVPDISVIIGSHTHHLLPEGEWCNDVLIAQAGEYAQHVGRVDLTVDTVSGTVSDRSAQVFPVPEDEPEDPAVVSALAAAEQEVERLRQQPLGESAVRLDLDHFGECGIGNLTADAFRERMHADGAILMSGLFHAGLPAGTITLGDLVAACFSSANPYVSELRGAQIVQALERGLTRAQHVLPQQYARDTGRHAADQRDDRVYDPDAPDGARIVRVLVNGAPLEPERIYRVAHSDAEWMRDYGYLVQSETSHYEGEVPTIVNEVIADNLRAHSPLPPRVGDRWVRVSSAG
jgi:2',3'-cyclic-nucleotide 2'-phosphodiesterase (5'-nucleotidase family)